MTQRSMTSAAVLTALIAALLSAAPHMMQAIGQTGEAARPKVRLNRVIERLEQGGSVIGAFPGGQTGLAGARALATSGRDFVMLDLQYGTFDITMPQMMLLGLIDKSAIVKNGNLQPNVVPFARIPVAVHDAPQFAVTQLLDTGLFGLMFPDIETKDQAATAVAAMRYPQRNRATVGGPSASTRPLNAAWYWGLSEAEYMQRADVWPLNPAGELLPILQIETAKGIENADEILQVPGIGVIFLGPGDLSRSLGEKSTTAPKTEAGVQKVLKGCLARKIACGYPIVAPNAEAGQKEVARRLAEGFRMVTVNVTQQ